MYGDKHTAHLARCRNHPKLMNTILKKHVMCLVVSTCRCKCMLIGSPGDSCEWIIKSWEFKYLHNAKPIHHKSDGNEWSDWAVMDEASQAFHKLSPKVSTTTAQESQSRRAYLHRVLGQMNQIHTNSERYAWQAPMTSHASSRKAFAAVTELQLSDQPT